MAYTNRTDPATMHRDWSSREPRNTVYPGRIKAIDDCAIEEKQNNPPPLIEPAARARKLVMITAKISKTFEYWPDNGAMMSCMIPRMAPRMKMMGRSINRAEKAKGPTHALAKP